MPRTRTIVFVRGADGRVEERTLTVGVSTRRSVEALAGVKEGEQILTGPAKGLGTLSPGKSVRLAKDAKDAKGAKP